MASSLELGVARSAARQGLKTMPIKASWLDVAWANSGMGGFRPKNEAWEAQIPQQIGANIKKFIESDAGTMRIYALKEEGFLRREQASRRFSGRPFSRMVGGKPLYVATVAEVTDVKTSHGRNLPILRLMEVGINSDRRDLMMSVPDLAHYVQSGEAQVDMTLDASMLH